MMTLAPAAPTADRPRLPREYGVPSHARGLRAWDEVEPRLRDARVYWVVTSGPGGVPHVRPVDGLWLDGRLYVGGSPETRWVRDLVDNPNVAVHLDGDEVLILEGTAELLARGADRETAERLAAESARKYPEYGMTVESYLDGPGPFAIKPRIGLSWKAFPKDVTRFRFG